MFILRLCTLRLVYGIELYQQLITVTNKFNNSGQWNCTPITQPVTPSRL